jgi:hypothetical protein
MTTQVWPNKDPDEIINLSFDFTDELGAATIDSKTLAVVVRLGTDPAAASMLNGAAQSATWTDTKLSPTTRVGVIQQIKLGVAECNYSVRCVATLSDTRVLVRGAILPVRWAA